MRLTGARVSSWAGKFDISRVAECIITYDTGNKSEKSKPLVLAYDEMCWARRSSV